MFEEWYLNDLITKEIKDTWKQVDYYLLQLIFLIIEDSGIDSLLKVGTTPEEIVNKKQYIKNSKNAIKWMLDRLVIDSFLIIKDDIYYLTDKKPDYDLDYIVKMTEKIASKSTIAFKMLKLMADNYIDFFEGKKSGVDIMFSYQSELIIEYYSDNLFYNVHNILGAKILNYDIEKREKPVILEVGGGLGGGTKQFVTQRMDNGLPPNNFEYIFTDIANKMLRYTKKALNITDYNLQSFSFRKLDFNVSLAEQGFEENSIDVIWGVNALHVAYNLEWTLKELKKVLKSGGSLIISETVRPIGNRMIQQEFLLNTLPDYYNVKLDPEIRPQAGFMDWKYWINALKFCDFDNVETIPNMTILEKEYDNCYVAVIRGIKK